jgi:hypothetical protein
MNKNSDSTITIFLVLFVIVNMIVLFELSKIFVP